MVDTGEDKKRGGLHTIDDHMFGALFDHEHDGDADHDHDDIDPGPLEENPIWQRDNVSLTSVGIDIGSAGTQVIFSRIHLQRVGTSLASRYVIVDRYTAHESPVSFTPYADESLIDGPALGKIIDDAYAGAGIRSSDIDTGVVILTGEALRRENAQAIAGIVAEKGGEFVTATAGNHMEAMLAAYGSGAAKASHDRRCTILNIDIGGGTTKLALVENGEVRWTAALHVGGRLIATHNGRVDRIDPAGRHHAKAVGVLLDIGAPAPLSTMQAIAARMVDCLERAVTGRIDDDLAALFLTDLPEVPAGLGGVMVSGGVGEYVAGRETRDFGDLGFHIGPILADRIAAGALGAPLIPAAACIRATALGASEYSVQLSGQTSTITSPGRLLPRRSMQVLWPAVDLRQRPGAPAIAAAILRHYEAFDLDVTRHEAALMFEYTLPPDYRDIRALADGVAAAMAPRIAAGLPLYIMIDGDIAQTLGGILRDELAVGVDLLILDGLSLRDFDFIDLGKIRLPSLTVPVTVKSLLFSDDPRAPSRADRIASAAALAQATPAQRHGHHHHDHDHHHAQAPKSPSPAVDSPVREPANKTPFPMTEREGQG